MNSVKVNKLLRTFFSRLQTYLKYVGGVVFLLLALNSFSETIIVGGELEESQTWTSDNIYIVNQDLIVPLGIRLTIQAGVLVKIDFGRGIFIENGSIEVLGNQLDTVSFIPNHINSGELWEWKGLYIKNFGTAAVSSISYARLVTAEIAIKLEDCHNVNIDNSCMHNCQNLGVLIVNSSSCLIDRCEIKDNYNGIEILATDQGESLNNIVSNCIIRNTNHNVTLQGEGEGVIADNAISDNLIENGNNGVWISCQDDSGSTINTIDRNLILNNGSQFGFGLFLAHSTTVVSNNIFWRNNIAIFSENTGDYCTINNNSFYQNNDAIFIGSQSEGNMYFNNTFSLNVNQILTIRETNDVVFTDNNMLNNNDLDILVKNQQQSDLSIANNFWGTTDTAVINNLVYDYWDNPSLGELDYKPYLSNIDTSNPISPPFNVIKQIDGSKTRITWNANQEQDLKAYKIYFGTYSNYTFSEIIDIGKDTSFFFDNSNFVFDTIAITASDSIVVSGSPQLSGHESPYAFAVLYPFAGRDTIFCDMISIFNIDNSNIPFEYESLHWSTSGDGFFSNPNVIKPTYILGINDLINGGATISLSVTTTDNVFVDSFDFSITDKPVVFAGNDTIIFPDMNLALTDAMVQNVDSVIWVSSGNGTYNNVTLVNPVYFPGSDDIESGFVVLKMITYSYCGIYSDSIRVIIDSYFSVEGKLWTNSKSTNPGVVIAFRENDEAARAVQIEFTESDGSFRFEKLIAANYYLYGLPDSGNIDNVVPCYYSNKERWQSAYLLTVDANVFDADIYLPTVDFILPMGEASISGHFVMPSEPELNNDIYCMPWFENSSNIFCNEGLSNVTVLLYNHDKTKLLDYTLTDDLGDFYFNQLPFGSYVVDAEKAGYETIVSPIISLSPEYKDESGVILEINQFKIGIYFDNNSPSKNQISIFPNPATGEISLAFSKPLLLSSKIKIYDLYGNKVLETETPSDILNSVYKIDIRHLSLGLYFGQISNSDQTFRFRFVKK